MTIPPSWPLDSHEHLAEALREQGATPEEIADLTPALLRLSEWQAPPPAPADTQNLLSWLVSERPVVSAVRQAIRARQSSQRSRLAWLLETARTQVSIFRPAFWLLSLLVTIVGAAVVLGAPLIDQGLVLRAAGPFLAYLGTISAFRGTQLQVLEFELVCLPSPLQLAMARLVIVLGYDVGLGLLLGLLLWAGGAGSFLALTLSWLMPLLLVAGLALLLSLRLSMPLAASTAYGGWLAVLALDSTPAFQALALTPLAETLLGGIGLALLAIALLRIQAAMPRILPHP